MCRGGTSYVESAQFMFFKNTNFKQQSMSVPLATFPEKSMFKASSKLLVSTCHIIIVTHTK